MFNTVSMTALGDRIKELRGKQGWSLDELAVKSKTSKAYLSQLENSQSLRPSATILYNIASALGTSIADLLGKKLVVEEPNDIPTNLKKAMVEFNIPKSYVKILSSVVMRTDTKKNRDLKPEDWNYLYETIRRIKEKK